MKNIKFRAFATGVNEMTFFYNVIVATGELSEGKAWGMFFPSANGKVFLGGYSDPMQFTGLLDKNGKEIYEGDIVSITNPLCQVQKARLIGVVGFSWAAFHVEIKRTVEWEMYNVDAPELMFLMNIANSKEIAVIGNIYENPELLAQ